MVLAALAVAATLVACGDSDSDSDGDSGTPTASSKYTGGPRDLSVRLFFAPTTLDPNAATELGAIALANYAYDTPVALRDGEIVPQLASRWEATPERVRLWIQDGITCADGSRLTAREVADSIDRLKDPRTRAARVASWLGSPDGYTATANADDTVDIELDRPYGDVLFGLTQVHIVCRSGLDDPRLLLSETHGSGPYTLTSSVTGDSYTYRKHDGYTWGPDGYSNEGDDVPSGIEFKVIENETTATNQFLTGALDLTMAQGPDVARLDRNARVTDRVAVDADTYGVRINHSSARPTSDADVRRLLFAGTDRQGLGIGVLGPGTRVPETIVLPRGICYQPEAIADAMLPYDVDAAIGYAEAAGYEQVDGKLVKDGRQLELTVLVPDVVGQSAADFLTQAWGRLGIKVDARVMATAQAVQLAFTPGGDWDVFVEGTGGGDSPSTMLRSYSGPPPPRGQQYAGVDNADFNRHADAAKLKLTQDACEDWGNAERSLYEQADVIPFAVADATWYGKDVTFKPWLLSAVYPDSIHWK